MKNNFKIKKKVLADPEVIANNSAVDLEVTILGAILMEKNAMLEVTTIISSPSTFSSEANRIIYRSCLELFRSAQCIDTRLVCEKLRKKGKLKRVGGVAYIASLVDSIASTSHIKDHARVVEDLGVRRRLAKASKTLLEAMKDSSMDTGKSVADMEEALTNSQAETTHYTCEELLEQYIARAETKNTSSVPTSYKELDEFLNGGLENSTFNIVAGRPGMGKTSFLVNLLYNMAKCGKKACFFSLEMTKEKITERLISIMTGIDGSEVQRGDVDWNEFYSKTEVLPQLMVDDSSYSIDELYTKVRWLKHYHGIDVIFIDHISCLRDELRGQTNQTHRITHISHKLKQLAKECEVVIIAASQLNRGVDSRIGNKKPMLSDLRDSGALEQDANIVLFPFRPQYYGILEDEEGSTDGLAEIIIGKNRNGRTGTVRLEYGVTTYRFKDNYTT